MLCIPCNNIALPSCFILIPHQNKFLMSLYHLITYISEKSIKNTTEQCSLAKKLYFVLVQNVPILRSLCFVDYVIMFNSPSASCFV